MNNKETEESKKERSFRLGRTLRLVWESAPRWTAVNIVLLLVLGLLPLLSLYLMKLVVDEVVAGMASSDKDAAFNQVALLIGFTGIVVLSEALCVSLSGLVKMAQSQRVTNHVQEILHTKSVEVDLEYYENPEYYNKMHRAQGDALSRPTNIVNGLTQTGRSVISLLAIVGLLFLFHWGLALILFAAAIPGVLVRLKYSGKVYHWQRKRTTKQRLNYYFHWLLTTDRHAKEVRLFDFGHLFTRRYHDLRKELNKEEFKIATRRTLAEFGAKTCATIALLGSYAFIAYKTVQGDITLGDMVMFFGAFQRGMGFLQNLLTGLAGLYEDNLFLNNFYEFLDLKQKVVEPSHPLPMLHPIQTGIVLNHVNFKYPSSTRDVLDDVSLKIRPGEHVAFVGENGVGKTTLIKLLCRLYDPAEGTITIDGIDLRQFRTSELRSEISVLFQDYAQYYLTARENIWLGNSKLPSDDERIVEAARRSGADKVINSLPQGYETMLGKWFEDGEELSIGQWQKVALARAFLRDSQIIILDEPTSALDAKAEYEVFRKFHQLAKGQTAIFISHRMSTVRMADRIFVLDDGKIAESGTHEELVSLDGIYARLFEMQAEKYR